MPFPPLFLSLAPTFRTAKDSDLPLAIDPLIINGIEFSLLNRWSIVKSTHRHECVTFQSVNGGIKQRFAAYKSNSYSFWRLLISDDSNKMFYKGSVDYIQQTFLHLDLQKYINANYMQLEQVADEYLKYSNPHFQVLPEENNDHPQPRDSSLFTEVEITQDLYRKSVISAIDSPGRIIELEPFNSYMKQEGNGCGEVSAGRDSNLIALSEQIRAMLPINGKPALVYKDYEHSDLEHSLRSDIYRIILGAADKDVQFYFMIFSFDSFGAFNVHKQNQFAPVFMTTNANVMPCGIYANYVPAGNFICKIMDYDWQCLESDVQCTPAYKYIADMYQNIYPFTTAALQGLLVPAQAPAPVPHNAGGRRRTGRRRRLRTRRRSSRRWRRN